MGKRASIIRTQGARAALCALAALLACALLIAPHWKEGPFSTLMAAAARTEAHGTQAAETWPRGEVDVNADDAEALQSLSGVGPVLAEAIVAEREADGPFDYPEDLTMVKGIGDKTLAKFFDQLDFSSRAGAF